MKQKYSRIDLFLSNIVEQQLLKISSILICRKSRSKYVHTFGFNIENEKEN